MSHETNHDSSTQTVKALQATGLAPARRIRPTGVGAILLGLALLLYVYVVLRTAWLCDDAYITFRTVDNFVSGHGLTWNVTERVQSYTHPLWMFLVSGVYWFTREIHYTVIFASMAISLAAVLIYSLRIARTVPQAIVGVLMLVFSKAFVDYSTSGLENPLTYLLLVLFLAVYLQDRPMSGRRLFGLSLIACLGILNRMDTLLLFAPALLEAWWRGQQTAPTPANTAAMAPGNDHGPEPATATTAGPGQCHPSLSSSHPLTHPPLHPLSRSRFTLSPCHLVTLSAVLGFLPFLAWEIFSVIYYGFPFPNTAYAKLNTGIPTWELAAQGLRYLQNSFAKDPLTLLAIIASLTAASIWRQRKLVMLAVGIALYVLYVVKIGGDFMSGRFLAVPLLAAVVLLGTLPIRLSSANWLSAALLVACAGFAAPCPSLLTTSTYGIAWSWNFDNDHVADERAYYYATTGLLANPLDMKTPSQYVIQTASQRRKQGALVTGMGTIGMYGYHIGPDAHVIDIFALSDPLLARLPMIYKPNWRIGHFVRHVPEGYIERLQYLQEKQQQPAGETAPGSQPALRENRFSDPNLETFHDQLCLIVRGPLFTRQRWAAIWNMNLGRYDHLIDQPFYRSPPERVWLGEVYGGPKPRGIARDLLRDADGNLPLTTQGIIVILPGTTHAPQLEISLDGNDDYRIDYPQLGRTPVSQEVPAVSDQPGQIVRRITVPAEVVAQGYNRFRVFPVHGDGRYSMHHVFPVKNETTYDRPVRPAHLPGAGDGIVRLHPRPYGVAVR